MIPIRHLLARSKKTSMATEATPPPMSSKVKPACPAAAEVTVSVTDLASTPSRGDDGGGDDGEGGTYVGHFCSYVPPSFLQSVLQVERFQHFLLHFLSFFFESSGHSFLHVLTSSSSLQNFLQNFLSEHDNGELGVGAGGEHEEHDPDQRSENCDQGNFIKGWEDVLPTKKFVDGREDEATFSEHVEFPFQSWESAGGRVGQFVALRPICGTSDFRAGCDSESATYFISQKRRPR